MPTPSLVTDMDGLFGANGIGSGNYGQCIVIDAVDQRNVISAIGGFSAEDKENFSLSIVEANCAVRTVVVCVYDANIMILDIRNAKYETQVANPYSIKTTLGE
jgi:hypothetical protein